MDTKRGWFKFRFKKEQIVRALIMCYKLLQFSYIILSIWANSGF